ncbi:TusE/DsrC/DsvC family sulfur relay protein [Halomonas sp. Bachu 37]|uniref:TusE/DsrC/DsvC family sulfur relay protein n=1 Tax=Halomonas kashgarensis TaxID=3084920 RepID=UPI0032173DFA
MASTEIYRYLDSKHQIPLDPENYLVKQEQWNSDIAELLAQEEGMTLTQAHWEIIEVVRRFYQDYAMAPPMRPLVKAVSNELGPEKGRSIYLMQLFPGSPAKLVAKLAGLPKPANCL